MKKKLPRTLGQVYGYPFFKKKRVIDQKIFSQSKLDKVLKELRYHYPSKGPQEITWEDFANVRLNDLRRPHKLSSTNLAG